MRLIKRIFGKKKSRSSKLVNINELQQGPKRKHKFSKDFMEATKYLQKTFYEVSPSPLKKWVDDFSRDANPEKELVIWLHVANKYNYYKNLIPNKLPCRKVLFAILLLRSMGMDKKNIISQVKPSHLTKKVVNEIIETFDKPFNKKWIN